MVVVIEQNETRIIVDYIKTEQEVEEIMITDKQFDDAFTAAGGWFILTQFETVYEWTGEKRELVDLLFLEGFDKKRTGTNTRVSSMMRIINNDRGREALEKIMHSKTINRQHPEAFSMARTLMNKYYCHK